MLPSLIATKAHRHYFHAALCLCAPRGQKAWAAFFSIFLTHFLAAHSDNSSVRILLEGSIEPTCSMSSSASTLELGDISGAGSLSNGFLIICNSPFLYRLRSRYGALKNTIADRVPPGFTNSIPYIANIQIPTTDFVINDTCSSLDISIDPSPCHFTSSGSAIALGAPSLLTISWQKTNTQPIGGDYVDQVTINIGLIF